MPPVSKTVQFEGNNLFVLKPDRAKKPKRMITPHATTQRKFLKFPKGKSIETSTKISNNTPVTISNNHDKKIQKYKKHLKIMISTGFLNHKTPSFKNDVIEDMKHYKNMYDPDFKLHQSQATVNRIIGETIRGMPQNARTVPITTLPKATKTQALLAKRKGKKTYKPPAYKIRKYQATPSTHTTINKPSNGYNMNKTNNNKNNTSSDSNSNSNSKSKSNSNSNSNSNSKKKSPIPTVQTKIPAQTKTPTKKQDSSSNSSSYSFTSYSNSNSNSNKNKAPTLTKNKSQTKSSSNSNSKKTKALSNKKSQTNSSSNTNSNSNWAHNSKNINKKEYQEYLNNSKNWWWWGNTNSNSNNNRTNVSLITPKR